MSEDLQSIMSLPQTGTKMYIQNHTLIPTRRSGANSVPCKRINAVDFIRIDEKKKENDGKGSNIYH